MSTQIVNWFADLVSLSPTAGEADYCRAWKDQAVLEASPEFLQAVRGGGLANSLSQAFIAGYQAAIRKTFPQVALPGITAFAVSEDRSESDPLPGVVWRPHEEGLLISGYKTWVAAVAQVEHLIVKARGPESGQSGYFLVPVMLDRVHLEVYPSSTRLPDLSQGKAFMDDVILPAEGRLDDSGVADFGRTEALMIYSAFLAMVWRRSAQDSAERSAATNLLLELHHYFLEPSATADLQALDKGVQTVLQQLVEGQWVNDQAFQRDQNLIAMYSRGLRNH